METARVLIDLRELEANEAAFDSRSRRSASRPTERPGTDLTSMTLPVNGLSGASVCGSLITGANGSVLRDTPAM